MKSLLWKSWWWGRDVKQWLCQHPLHRLPSLSVVRLRADFRRSGNITNNNRYCRPWGSAQKNIFPVFGSQESLNFIWQVCEECFDLKARPRKCVKVLRMGLFHFAHWMFTVVLLFDIAPPIPSPWYNRTSWLGIKHQLTYNHATPPRTSCTFWVNVTFIWVSCLDFLCFTVDVEESWDLCVCVQL